MYNFPHIPLDFTFGEKLASISSKERLTLRPIKITVAEDKLTIIIIKYKVPTKIPQIPISIFFNMITPKSNFVQTLVR